MKELKVKFENCYGIKKLDHTFDFSKSNVQLIYAKNGSMKTSFTKIFEKYKEGKQLDIKDNIFEEPETFLIIGKNDWLEIKGNKENKNDNPNNKNKNIFIIESLYDGKYESTNITNLLLNNDLKKEFNNILELKFNLLKKLKVKTGLAISKEKTDLNISRLEQKLLEDFELENKNFLDSLDQIILKEDNDDIKVLYKDIFDNSTLEKLIESQDFQNNIDNFITKSTKIYTQKKYNFLDKGNFSFGKFKEVQKSLKSNKFFVKKNKIILTGAEELAEEELDEKELEKKLEQLITEFTGTKEFIKISDNLNKSEKGKKLLSILEEQPDIIKQLKDFKKFRQKLWSFYLKEKEDNSPKTDFELLKIKYKELKEKITEDNLKNSDWRKAVDIFNKRFSMPFKMEIGNLKNAIFGDVPLVEFHFCNKENFEDCKKDEIIKKNKENILETLSQGEKRALYLLNIIFDIENLKKEIIKEPKREILFIIDDIADSFDYKNKYAIIEYLQEIAENKNFYTIILTHNFDFFRTLSSRLNTKENQEENWRFLAKKDEEKLILESTKKELNNPFCEWIKKIKKKEEGFEKYIIALIPFSREIFKYYNLDRKIFDEILYGFKKIKIEELRKKYQNLYYSDRNIFDKILHGSKKIKIEKLREKYQNLYNFDEDYNFGEIENDNKNVITLINDVSKKIINNNDESLEAKIILALNIRIITEKFLKDVKNMEKNDYPQMMQWYKKNVGKNDKYEILKEVNIITPENIHLNSFMYEPILDMDIIELKDLYKKVEKHLKSNNEI